MNIRSNRTTGHRRRTAAIAAAAIALAATITTPISALATDHPGKTVAELQGNNPGTDCYYFRLDGVTQADPILPNNSWFAIDRSTPGAKDAFALLLAARLSGTTVHVVTYGAYACGYAAAGAVTL